MGGFTTMMLFGLSLVSMTIAVPNYDPQKVHLEMTHEEMRETFQTEPNDLPDYELIYPDVPSVQKRSLISGRPLLFNAFGKNIRLWLNPTEGTLAALNTPVYHISSSRRSPWVTFTKLSDAMETVEKILEDRAKRATLIVKRSADGRSIISGTVESEDLVIKPLPTRFSRETIFGKSKRSIDFSNDSTGEYYEPHPHVVFRTPKMPEEEAQSIENRPIEDVFSEFNVSRSKRSYVKDIIYPEILLIADYDTYIKHNSDDARLVEYLVTFWNNVDLRYRTLSFPTVRLNIAGIIIAKDPKALSYITANKIDGNTLNIYKALEDFSLFMLRRTSEFPFPKSYDIAITMTTNRGRKKNSSKNSISGLAYLGGACTEEKDSRNKIGIKSVAIVVDNGGYDGVWSASHEVAHLLGVPHDDADSCYKEVGYIMSPDTPKNGNLANWSKCSLNHLNSFLFTKKSKCLHNSPKTSKALPRVLPGELLTLDEQCARTYGTRRCNKPDDPCIILWCYDKNNPGYCIGGNAAADGSSCGYNKICMHGQCLDTRRITD